MKNIKLHSTSTHVQEESRWGCFDVHPARPRPPSRHAGVIDRVAARAPCRSGAMSLGEGVTLPGLRRKDCCLHNISGVRLELVSRVRAERPRRFRAQPSGIFETNPEMIWIIVTNRPVFQLTGSKISFLSIPHVFLRLLIKGMIHIEMKSSWMWTWNALGRGGNPPPTFIKLITPLYGDCIWKEADKVECTKACSHLLLPLEHWKQRTPFHHKGKKKITPNAILRLWALATAQRKKNAEGYYSNQCFPQLKLPKQ